MITGTPLGCVRILLPVKAFATAKSRLKMPSQQRAAIATRLFQNTLETVLQCAHQRQVFVTSADAGARAIATSHGVGTFDELSGDLNTALHAAIGRLRLQFPDDTIVVVVTDLPRLAVPDLMAALQDAASSSQPRHVMDHRGTGTTFISLPPRRNLPMLFGPGSARRFTEAGSVPMLFPPPALAHDLDVLADWAALSPDQKEKLCPGLSSP